MVRVKESEPKTCSQNSSFFFARVQHMIDGSVMSIFPSRETNIKRNHFCQGQKRGLSTVLRKGTGTGKRYRVLIGNSIQ